LVAVKGKQGATLAGRYRLLEQLGEGGMGSVWKAEHLLLHSHVAIKIIDPDIAHLEFNLARFLREAKTLATLRSPHVVQVLDFGSDADTPYLVMELLQGQTLGRRLSEQGRLTLGETSRVLYDVCAAMSLVHGQGLIHRDLKPDNIFLCNVGGQRVTKVVDFGIAKSLRGDMTTGSMKTRTGHMLGTPSYMSPEQCRGLKDIDHRADLWALGVIAYECLVGKVPFDGEVLGDLLLRICMDPLPIPSQQARGALPAEFDAWFAKAVARDRVSRFQSALELATSLSELSPAVSSPAVSSPAVSSAAINAPMIHAPAREAVEASRPSAPRISLVPPMPVPRPAANTETNTSVGLVGASRRVERRARVAASVGVALVAAVGLWAIADKRNADGAMNVEVQSLRPPYEVTPKVIRPGVPSGRRWQPSGAAPAGLPSSNASAAPDGASGAPAAPAAGAALAPSTASAGVVEGGVARPNADWRSAAGVTPAAPSVAPPITSALSPTAPNLPGPGMIAQPARAPSGQGPAAVGGAAASPAGSSAPTPAPPSVAPPVGAPPSVAPSASPPRPSHGRQLYPSPAPAPPSLPLRPLRGTAAPSRAHPLSSSEADLIRPAR
jgi:serine/threonine-protein kinase